jgi:hypothetical protein
VRYLTLTALILLGFTRSSYAGSFSKTCIASLPALSSFEETNAVPVPSIEDLLTLVPADQRERLRPLMVVVSRGEGVTSDMLEFAQGLINRAGEIPHTFTYRKIGYVHGSTSLKSGIITIEFETMHSTESWFPLLGILFNRTPRRSHFSSNWYYVFLRAAWEKHQVEPAIKGLTLLIENPVNRVVQKKLIQDLHFQESSTFAPNFYRHTFWIDIPFVDIPLPAIE